MDKEYIERGAVAKKAICMHGFGNVKYVPLSAIMNQASADVVEIPSTGIGDLSDGYHTFNELYHHRAVLFAALCNTYPDRAWKSMRHHDGDMYSGMFIVGIETPAGQATYHYDVVPYWDMFDVKVLKQAPEWDGHTPSEALRRIFSLTVGKPLEAFLHPIDAYKGLKAKYLVFKADTGKAVENCFVLCPDKDPAAVEALRVYARATDNETLAEDICNWVGKDTQETKNGRT